MELRSLFKFIYFWQKNDRNLFCLFVAPLSDFSLLWKKIEALIELKKMLLRKTLFDVRLGNCPTPKVLISHIPHILQIYWICKDAIDVTSRWKARGSILDKLPFQNKVSRVLYKLVVVRHINKYDSVLYVLFIV